MAKSMYYEIRKEVAPGSGCPVKIVDGDTPPEMTGESWHYRTRGGSYIYHPSAYKKTGWSNMVYHASSFQIIVGREWVKNHAPRVIARIAKKKLLGNGRA